VEHDGHGSAHLFVKPNAAKAPILLCSGGELELAALVAPFQFGPVSLTGYGKEVEVTTCNSLPRKDFEMARWGTAGLTAFCG
jgi:hypothetical protein